MRKCHSLPYLLLADLAKRFGLMLAAQSIGLALAFAAPAGAQEISPRQETPAIRPHMQEQPQTKATRVYSFCRNWWARTCPRHRLLSNRQKFRRYTKAVGKETLGNSTGLIPIPALQR
jgi:hypothetical protein